MNTTNSIVASIVDDFEEELNNAKQSDKDLITIVISDKYDIYYKEAVDKFLKETNYPYKYSHSDYDRSNQYNIILLDNFKNKVFLFGEEFDKTLSKDAALYTFRVKTNNFFNASFVIITGKIPDNFFHVNVSSTPSDKNLSLEQYEEVIVSIHCNCEDKVFEEYNKYRLNHSVLFRLYKIPLDELKGLFETFDNLIQSNGWIERVFDNIIYMGKMENTIILNPRNLEFELALGK